MLDFLNLKKSGYLCELCRESIKGENCTPKSCSHMFHINCLEDWASDFDCSSGFACPVSGCSLSFSEILIRKTPGSVNFTVTSFKENHQCPICCERIRKPVATPESCNHAFCYICLKEWSRVRHECPLDRGVYELILLSDWVGGPIIKRTSQPVSIRLGRPPSYSNSHHRSQIHNIVRSECNGQVSGHDQSEPSRKRLRILSSSDSDSDDQNGVILRNTKLTGHRSRLLRSPSESEVEEFPVLAGPSSSHDSNGIQEGNIVIQTSTISLNGDVCSSRTSESSHMDFIQDSTFEVTHSKSDSENSNFDETFVPAVKNPPKKRKTTRKTKRRLSKKAKGRHVKKRSLKSRSFKRLRNKTMRKKIRKLSSSLPSVSPKPSTSSQLRVRNGLIGSSLPKLSILGKESQCDFRLLVDEDDDKASIVPSLPIITASSTSNNSISQPNPRSSTYLSDIEAGQASLFRFSTRHMQVNPDHSMSPIPVAKVPSLSTNKVNIANSVNNKFPSLSTVNSISSPSTSDRVSSVSKPLISSNSNTNSQVKHYNNTPAKCSVINNPIPSTSHSCPSEVNPSHCNWSSESLQRVKSTLKHHLKAYVSSHRIDKETCRNIFQRSLSKVIVLFSCTSVLSCFYNTYISMLSTRFA
ncbi:unnamed protein product [Schistosoma haematobium]|nr:unnamed protein product [Schistosoma haematobium]